MQCEAYTTHASITARPFFEKRGYRVVRAQQVERQGLYLTNYVMEKRRGGAGELKKAESPVFRQRPGGGAFRCVSAVSHGSAAGKACAALRRKTICYDFARFSLSA